MERRLLLAHIKSRSSQTLIRSTEVEPRKSKATKAVGQDEQDGQDGISAAPRLRVKIRSDLGHPRIAFCEIDGVARERRGKRVKPVESGVPAAPQAL